MDYVRTPYTRTALLTPDGNVQVTLRWYPAPAGAKLFPYWHRFASGDWSVKDEPSVWNGVGELKSARRRWWPGTPIDAYQGQCFVGPLDWYQNGVPVAATVLPPEPLPPCCIAAPVVVPPCPQWAIAYPTVRLTITPPIGPPLQVTIYWNGTQWEAFQGAGQFDVTCFASPTHFILLVRWTGYLGTYPLDPTCDQPPTFSPLLVTWTNVQLVVPVGSVYAIQFCNVAMHL